MLHSTVVSQSLHASCEYDHKSYQLSHSGVADRTTLFRVFASNTKARDGTIQIKVFFLSELQFHSKVPRLLPFQFLPPLTGTSDCNIHLGWAGQSLSLLQYWTLTRQLEGDDWYPWTYPYLHTRYVVIERSMDILNKTQPPWSSRTTRRYCKRIHYLDQYKVITPYMCSVL